MTEADIYQGLQGVFNKVFRREDIKLTPGLSAKDVPGWDSFRFVSLIMATEEHFTIKLDTDELENLTNIGDLVKVIAGRAH
jgi:acyl carrier protein